MDVTSEARRSDSLYFSTDGSISRRWLCNRIARLENENDSLRKELEAREDRTNDSVAEQLSVSEGAYGHAICSKCHETIDPYDRYCRHCGASISNRWEA